MVKPINMLMIVIFLIVIIWSLSSILYSIVNSFEGTSSILTVLNVAISVYVFTICWQWSVVSLLFEKKTITTVIIHLFQFYLVLFWISSLVFAHYRFFMDGSSATFSVPLYLSDIAYYSYILIAFFTAKKLVSKEWRGKAYFIDYVGTGLQIIVFPLSLFFIQKRVHNLAQSIRDWG